MVLSRRSLRLGQSSETIAYWRALIYIPNKRKEQKADLCLSFNGFFNPFIQGIIFSSMLFYLSSNLRLKSISEDLNKGEFFGGSASIELHKDGLQIFKIRGPILRFLLLVLTISSNLISDDIYKQPKVSKILLKEGFELTLKQEIFASLVV